MCAWNKRTLRFTFATIGMTSVTARAQATCVIVTCLIDMAGSAAAADAADRYPTRPIRVVNPYAPGGITDITVRTVMPHVAQTWGQQVVIDNRPGAGTNIGTEIVVRAQPDGYTLLATTGAISTNPSFYPNLSFRATRNLAPVVLLAETPGALAIQTGLPAKTLPEFIALARSQPGQLTLASAGTGTSTHLAIELLKSMINRLIREPEIQGRFRRRDWSLLAAAIGISEPIS